MSPPDVKELRNVTATGRREVQRDLRQIFLSGIALTIPFFITVLVLLWALNFVSGMLTPLVDVLGAIGPGREMGTLLLEVLAASLVFGLIFLVGLAAQHGPNTNLHRRVDTLMKDIPGVGTVYDSVERMSDVLVEGDTESFQEVKLVEFPTDQGFALAFLTADTPSEIEDASGEGEMLTVFVPMAPNPVMGGHLLHLPEDRIHDVDMSVEEGMEAIMSTGLTIDSNGDGKLG